jgi:hypothetical protein
LFEPDFKHFVALTFFMVSFVLLEGNFEARTVSTKDGTKTSGGDIREDQCDILF